MKVKKFLWVPETSLEDAEKMGLWLYASEEQGGLYDTYKNAIENRKDYKGFVLIPVDILFGEKIELNDDKKA